jgi:hypothetical protein
MRLFSPKSLGTFALAAQVVNGLEAKQNFDVFKYVDPLIGTSNGGQFNGIRVLIVDSS